MIQADCATLSDKVATEKKKSASVIPKRSVLLRFTESQFMLMDYAELYIKPEVKLSRYREIIKLLHYLMMHENKMQL